MNTTIDRWFNAKAVEKFLDEMTNVYSLNSWDLANILVEKIKWFSFASSVDLKKNIKRAKLATTIEWYREANISEANLKKKLLEICDDQLF